jgi:hypothetical protein
VHRQLAWAKLQALCEGKIWLRTSSGRKSTQFHLNGFEPGDPDISHPACRYRRREQGPPPEETDVLIVGCGPAGLTLAAAFVDRFMVQ